ncbi:MAG: glutaminase [Bacteroidetes bacterium HGW-Bacteroidetes-1]|jgi:glutaminase|nr:MAG: glutaminase [Bacteroidetes bacterium HGW-Bacteroidetes-1]
MEYQQLIERIFLETKSFAGKGKVASYIPALERISPDKYGISLINLQQDLFGVGDTAIPFSIQSISKVFTFTIAYSQLGAEIWKRIGREPSGTAFNSLVQLEYEHGIPRNPFINAGSIVVADILISLFPDPKQKLLEFVRTLAGDQNIYFNEDIALSEKETGHRNYALAHFMKSFGNIHNPVEKVLDFYFHQCSLELCTNALAKSFLFLANEGINPQNEEQIITSSQAKRLKALMLTSGLYNESGDFAFKVGMPAKSGVGGGIVAVIPNLLSIVTWSPPLNSMGNSVVGIEALERFTTYTGKSIF